MAPARVQPAAAAAPAAPSKHGQKRAHSSDDSCGANKRAATADASGRPVPTPEATPRASSRPDTALKHEEPGSAANAAAPALPNAPGEDRASAHDAAGTVPKREERASTHDAAAAGDAEHNQKRARPDTAECGAQACATSADVATQSSEAAGAREACDAEMQTDVAAEPDDVEVSGSALAAGSVFGERWGLGGDGSARLAATSWQKLVEMSDRCEGFVSPAELV